METASPRYSDCPFAAPGSIFLFRPAGCAVLLFMLSALGGARAAETIDFARDIRPILSDNCFTCHGPDKRARKADLRLDSKAGAFADRDGGPVIKPGEPDESELWRRITAVDRSERMPPEASKRSLTQPQIALIRRWIEQGARYEQHWSFQPIRAVAVPNVERTEWPRNAIDHFILARLEREGLSPSPEAGRERLIRRLSFDLTGLPPSLDELDAFLNDDSAQAYEQLVDRLLAKPAYGERMASDWLDVARYSDTYGYQVDRDRFVWPWRDWVIDAFNANLPYDRFILWQLAGDLLPRATREQKLATTFNRLHPQKVEGGSVPEEFRVEYVADRNHTFGTAFLGLALECARCHDHKYDPMLQKEYYQLYAFFNNIDEAGLYSYFTKAVPTPTLRLADEATTARIDDLRKQALESQRELAAVAQRERAGFDQWLANRPVEPVMPGRIAHLDFEDHEGGANESVPGRTGKAVKLSGDDGIGLKVGNFRRFDPFSVSLWINTPDVKKRAVVFHRSRAWTDAGSRGYQLLIEDGRLSASLIHFWPGNAIRVRTREPIPIDRWLHVAVTYDGSSRAAGLRIYVDGESVSCDVVRDNLYKNITGGGGDNITIGQRFRDRGFTNGLVDEFSVFDRTLTAIEVAQLHDGTSLTTALTAEPSDSLYAYYLATVNASYQTQLAAVRSAREQLCKTADGVREIMSMRELSQPRPTFLLTRGAYDAPSEPVRPDTPAMLLPFPQGEPRNRLGLARWLTDSRHPLTARVAVNRLWQMCFGQGLVPTPEDFGSQGGTPSHPGLLDWLARDFIEHRWDVKRLQKRMVMSATYRQSSAASPSLLTRDPKNTLLARAPRYRWPAEMLRDNALAVSGLLVEKIGGPPARPYEVEVSFKPVKRDKGDGLHRRSLYTYWKRTAPAPVMMTFDASKRDVCRVQRERTTSPLQAFVLLNGTQFVEAARALGQRLIHKHGGDTEAIVVDLFRIVISRRPTDAEQRLMLALYDDQLAYFDEQPDRAEAFLSIGEAERDRRLPATRSAAIGVVAHTLMNFDEAVMKR